MTLKKMFASLALGMPSTLMCKYMKEKHMHKYKSGMHWSHRSFKVKFSTSKIAKRKCPFNAGLEPKNYTISVFQFGKRQRHALLLLQTGS